MPQRLPVISVNPDLLKWARESAGWTLEEIAKRLKIPAELYRQWEVTGAGIKVSQLEALAHYYKRPLAAFFLPKPPAEPKPPKDFRALPGRRDKFDRKTLLAIRRALRLQTIASELAEALEVEKMPQAGAVNSQESPEQASLRERELLGASIEEQTGWRSEYEALNRWRGAVEIKNVFVFSIPMPVDDARGFSLGERLPWAIVLNSSDGVRARIFTLFHEYAHLLLRSPGVCIPQREWVRHSRVEGEERWCNQFAAALLLPARELRNILNTRMLGADRLSETLSELSRRFKVSREVALRRLLSLELISQQHFWDEMDRIRHVIPPKKKRGFGAPPLACVRGNGKLFTRMVLESRERGLITYANVADLLGIKLKHLDRVQALVAA